MAKKQKNNPVLPAADSVLMRTYTIRKSSKETYDTFSLELEPCNGDGYVFFPGQFNMLYVFGIGEVPISISGDPEEKGKLVHTIRAVGSVTSAMKDLKVGQVLGIRGPYGSHWPIGDAVGNDIVIVAGGIGLPPLRPVIYHLLSHREDYGKIVLLYGARTPEEIVYRRFLEKLRSRFDVEVGITVDRATGGWRGNVGVVTTLIGRAQFDSHHCTVFVCGPEIMMRFTILELQKRGVGNNDIYISMERNMKCGIGLCGHCQLGPSFICKDGPVYNYGQIKDLLMKREM